jgi:mannose-P-dolichol utilization defect 1
MLTCGAWLHKGVSLISYLVELVVYTVSIAYNVRRGYAFLTYGETLFLAAQDLLVLLLIFAYGNAGPASRRPTAVLVLPLVYAAGAYLLADAERVPTAWLEAGVAASTFVLTASRLPQLYTNFANGSTGQLSAITVLLLTAGALARVFTTLKEVPDPVILRGMIAGAAVNVALSAQLLYYWNAPAAQAAATSKAKAARPAAVTAAAAASTASPAKRRSNKVE